MKAIKVLAILISFTLISTGCNHDHSHSHEEKLSEKEKTHQSKTYEKTNG